MTNLRVFTFYPMPLHRLGLQQKASWTYNYVFIYFFGGWDISGIYLAIRAIKALFSPPTAATCWCRHERGMTLQPTRDYTRLHTLLVAPRLEAADFEPRTKMQNMVESVGKPLHRTLTV